MPDPDPPTDRRAVPRLPCRASFCRLLGGTPTPVEVRDISPAGAGIVCAEPLQSGEVLTLQLSGRRVRLSAALRARVVWARQRPDGRWEAGCAFDPALPPSLIQSLK